MVSLKLQRRLAASILKCAKGKVWLDPNEIKEISISNSRMNIRSLVNDGYIIKKSMITRSLWQTRQTLKAKMEGRHSGYGKRKGTREARLPSEVLWMKKIRVLRRLLHRYRELGKIDKHLYHEMYLKVKGNAFKNKRMLVEIIHKVKAERIRERVLSYQYEAKKRRNNSVIEK
ncbi:Ribosomal protein L19 [Quillaja saponaria]|uniref:Ribosomal protein L19 n=1 Tax=Quillaja saponaria TaxID=32244 RepID=A0AAD7Q5P2_QUISA|nr:Ribosomal protein L19 [Quillaja saponaria]